MFTQAIRFAVTIFLASEALLPNRLMADSTPIPSGSAPTDSPTQENMMRQESIQPAQQKTSEGTPTEDVEVFAIKEMSFRSAKTAARLFCTKPKGSVSYADGLRFFGNYPEEGIELEEKYALTSRKTCAESLLPSAVALYLKSKIPVEISFAKAMTDSKFCQAKVLKKGYRPEGKLVPWAKSIARGKKRKSCLTHLSSESEFLVCANGVSKKSERIKPSAVEELKKEFSLGGCTADARDLRLSEPFFLREEK